MTKEHHEVAFINPTTLLLNFPLTASSRFKKFARQKVKQLYISNSEFSPHKRVKCKQSVNKCLYPVYKSPKNVVYKQRLQARLGRLPYSYIQKIDKALAVSIGLWDKC